ncbi:MAG: NAD(P)/FAD-dependent oxidoreductase [Chloroflexota bacterium]
MRQTMGARASRRPRVVIVGAGFAGLSAARALAHSAVDVLVIDRNNYHTFLPLLYQVAAAELEPESISYPLRSILRSQPQIRFTMGGVEAIDLSARSVKTTHHVIHYDFLVLATGSVSRFFGVAGSADNAFQLKTIDHAVALRNHILCCFENAATETDPDRRCPLLTFVIVGDGATGVEFAGALAELVHGPVKKDYPTLNVKDVRIVLLQAVDCLLPELPGSLREYALSHMRRIGVEALLSTEATRIAPDSVYLKDGQVIPTQTVVWTAGVQGDGLADAIGLPVSRDSRVRVLPTLQAPGHPELYAVGDLAYFLEDTGRALPLVAQVAIQQGRAAALNIKRQSTGRDPVPFKYRPRGSVAAIGRGAAAVVFGKWHLTGFLAWVLWLWVHIFNLIGFRNRLLVMVNWAWDFLFYERGVKIIVPSESCTTPPERSPSSGTAIPTSEPSSKNPP